MSSTEWLKWGTDMASYARNAAQQASTMMAGTELEKKLAEATSNEPWGASGTLLSEIARATFAYEDFKTVTGHVWRNAALTGSLWRVVYKTLNLLDYLLRHGSERCIEDARDHIRELKRLQKFEYTDPEGDAGKDQGANVREKARQLLDLLNNEESLNQERDKARAAKNKFGGVSSQEASGNMGAKTSNEDPKPGFSDDDFKFAAERGRKAQQASQVDTFGLTSMVSSMYSQATEYATAASKQLQSMQTLFPSNELDKKLTDALSNEPDLPSSSLLYELGRATHREDDYRIILSAIWQNVLRSNQRPRVVLKTLMVLEAVLLHGPDRALEETTDMKTDIKALQSFSATDFNEAGKVQEKASDIIELLEDGVKLQDRRGNAADGFGGSGSKYGGFSSADFKAHGGGGSNAAPTSPTAKSPAAASGNLWDSPTVDDGFGAAFESLKTPEPQQDMFAASAPPPAPVVEGNLFDVGTPPPAPAPAPAPPPAPPDAKDPFAVADGAAAAPSAASSLSSSIGKIHVPGRSDRERPRASAASGGITLGKLPAPAGPGPTLAGPGPSLAKPVPVAAAAESSAADDLLGLIEGPTPSAAAAAADGLLGDLSMGPSGAADLMGLSNPPPPPPMDEGFGDFDAATPPPPPKTAAELLLENSMSGLELGDAPPAPVLAASAPAPSKPMGSGSGLGLTTLPAAPPKPPMGQPLGGMGSMGGGPMGGMGSMGGAPMGCIGGVGAAPMGGMGGQMGGGPPPMGGMGGQLGGGAPPMGGMHTQMGGMGGMGGPAMGGMGQQMGGMGMGGGMPPMNGAGMQNHMGGMPPMGGGMGGGGMGGGGMGGGGMGGGGMGGGGVGGMSNGMNGNGMGMSGGLGGGMGMAAPAPAPPEPAPKADPFANLLS